MIGGSKRPEPRKHQGDRTRDSKGPVPPVFWPVKAGMMKAGDRIRTGDYLVGNQELYH